MQLLTRVAMVCSASLLLAGCAKSDGAAADTAAAAAPASSTAAPPPLDLADVAGKWQVSNMPASGKDTTTTITTLTATADSTGWSLTLPSGAKVPLHVVVDGDSVVTTTDVYDSIRRKGMKVVAVSTFRLQNGMLAGSTTAHFQNAGADSVLQLHTEATKVP